VCVCVCVCVCICVCLCVCVCDASLRCMLKSGLLWYDVSWKVMVAVTVMLEVSVGVQACVCVCRSVCVCVCVCRHIEGNACFALKALEESVRLCLDNRTRHAQRTSR